MYRLVAIVMLSLVVGCSQQQRQDLRPFVAVAVAYSLQATPATPAVVPGGKCRNCRGTKKVGDGTIETKCPACDGTGVEPAPKAEAQ